MKTNDKNSKKRAAPPRYDEAFRAGAVRMVTEQGRPTSGCFINHQHYRIALNYVQTYVVSGVEKISSGFWWIYTCLGRGNLYGPILCLCGAVFDVGCADDRQKKRRGFQKGGFGA